MTESSTVWHHPLQAPVLGRDDVHVWRAALDVPAARLGGLIETLADDERAKAARFHFQQDRAHYIAARGILRRLLGGYVGAAPSRLRFGYSPYGKPALAEGCGDGALRFNVSHAGGLALYAVTRHRAVGVDLEYMRPGVADEQVAERHFSPREVSTLRTLPPAMQTKAFYDCWTRKEAFIKARGEGLSLPLDQFDVSLAPTEPAALLGTQWDPEEAARWSMRALHPGPGYAAALAVEGRHFSLTCWQWPG